MDPIPQLQQSQNSLRNQDVIGRIRARTEIFESNFHPNFLYQLLSSGKSFSRNSPPAKSVGGIRDPIGLSYLT